MKRVNLLLAGLVLVLVLNSGIGSAWAYFTTYAEARGGWPVERGGSTEVKEEFSAWTKRVTVANDEGAEPIFVRARAYCSEQYPLVYTSTSGRWTDGGDGWWYYADAVSGGASTDELRVRIQEVPRTAVIGESFNVVVVYESAPVQYRADGTPYADWTEGGGNG